MVTQNYGRLGGTLDNTEHLEAAAKRLCTHSEQTHWRAGEVDSTCRLVVEATVQPGVAKARFN